MLILSGIAHDQYPDYYSEVPHLQLNWDVLKTATTFSAFKQVVEDSDPSIKHGIQWGQGTGMSVIYNLNVTRGASLKIAQTPIPTWENGWAGFNPYQGNHLKDSICVLESFGFPKRVSMTGTPMIVDNKISFMTIYLVTTDNTLSVPLIYWVKVWGLVSASISKKMSFFRNPNSHDGFWALNSLVDLGWPQANNVESTITADFKAIAASNPIAKQQIDQFAGKKTKICLHMPFNQISLSGKIWDGADYYLKNLSIEY